MQLVILSGRSGSGKSICLHALEDIGFYCVDNLPIALLPNLIDAVKSSYERVVVSIDARNLQFDPDSILDIINEFKSGNNLCDILYLDANEETLIKRFNETRRKHPLANEHCSLQEAIQQEKHLLASIDHLSNCHIDTSNLSIKELRNIIFERFAVDQGKHFHILLQSFGYRYGLPSDADFIFDVRCLPNPYWEPSLRQFNGLEHSVQDYLNAQPITHEYLDMLERFFLEWLPKFNTNDRIYLNIAFGCTGGYHRSVFIADTLYKRLCKKRSNLQLRHREL